MSAISGRSVTIGSTRGFTFQPRVTSAPLLEKQEEFEQVFTPLESIDPNFGISGIPERRRIRREQQAQFLKAPVGSGRGSATDLTRIEEINLDLQRLEQQNRLANERFSELEAKLPQRFVTLRSGRSFPAPKIVSGSALDVARSNVAEQFTARRNALLGEKLSLENRTGGEFRKKLAADSNLLTIGKSQSESGRTESVTGELDFAGTKVKTPKGSLFAAINSLLNLASLPQATAVKSSGAGELKAEIAALQDVQNQRLSSQQQQLNQKQFEKAIIDSPSLTDLQKAKKIAESRKVQPVSETQFVGARTNVASAAVNLGSSRIARTVTELINQPTLLLRQRLLEEEQEL